MSILCKLFAVYFYFFKLSKNEFKIFVKIFYYYILKKKDTDKKKIVNTSELCRLVKLLM